MKFYVILYISFAHAHLFFRYVEYLRILNSYLFHQNSIKVTMSLEYFNNKVNLLQFIAPASLLGVRSFISGTDNFWPLLIREIINAVERGDARRAQELQEKLTLGLEAISATGKADVLIDTDKSLRSFYATIIILVKYIWKFHLESIIWCFWRNTSIGTHLLLKIRMKYLYHMFYS